MFRASGDSHVRLWHTAVFAHAPVLEGPRLGMMTKTRKEESMKGSRDQKNINYIRRRREHDAF